MTKFKIGDRVKKRGFDYFGTVERVKDNWITIKWDYGPITKNRPLICHSGELEKVK